MKIRDEKGRFASDMPEKQKEAICYKSKLLNKYFDNYNDLVTEEEAYKKAHEAELRAKEQRKVDAEIVKSAIKNRIEIEIKSRKEKEEAYKVYLKSCEEADKKVEAARAEEADKLSNFCKKYPEGFHDTIKIGDIDYNCSYNADSDESSFYLSPFARLLSWF